MTLQTNAGIEVHRFFRFYLGHSALTARMDLAQTAVNILYMLRDYAPLVLVLALAVLPYELYAHEVSSTLSADLAQHGPVLRVHRALLLIAWFCNKLWYLVFYNHVGLSRVWYFQSNEIWAAPCEWQSRLLTPWHSMYIHLTQESRMPMKLTTGVSRYGLPMLHIIPPVSPQHPVLRRLRRRSRLGTLRAFTLHMFRSLP